jgi:hypothetical protein
MDRTCKSEIRNAYKTLIGKPERKGPIERTRSKCTPVEGFWDLHGQ